MKSRFVAAGTLEAQQSFRRLKGREEMPTVITTALHRHGACVTPPEYDLAAA